MTKVPSLSYVRVVAALQRLGFVVLRHHKHIWMRRILPDGKPQYVPIPAHKPIKRTTLAGILKMTGISVEEFIKALSGAHDQLSRPKESDSRENVFQVIDIETTQLRELGIS